MSKNRDLKKFGSFFISRYYLYFKTSNLENTKMQIQFYVYLYGYHIL